MKRILFVDDDANVLNGLRRGLHSMRGEWQMEFANSAQSAMEVLNQVPVDALVTDVRMRHTDGFQLLKETRDAHPQILRIVLSGQTEENAFARAFASTHLFLGKPCDTEILKRRIRNLLERGDHIRDATLKSLVAKLGGVPSVSLLFFDIVKQFSADDPNLDKIADTVSMDMGMSSTVLHFVNSGYFGTTTLTSNPARAVRWLGLETTRSLVVRNRACWPFDASGFEYFDILNLWSNAMSMATTARAVALSHSKDSVLADDAFATGMFHDIGQVILARVLGHFYDLVIQRSISSGEPLWKTEREMIGSTHAEVGAYLLGLWGTPDAVVNAVAQHHSASEGSAEEFNVLTALQIAHAVRQQEICKTRF